MTCAHCGCIFCPDSIEQWADDPSTRLYCSKGCKKHAKWDRNGTRARYREARARRDAPRVARVRKARRCTDKIRYPSEKAVKERLALLRLLREMDPSTDRHECGYYECECGGFHLTSRAWATAEAP